MKALVKTVLFCLLSPLRYWRCRRDGRAPLQARQELPNDVFLGLVRDSIREGGVDAETGKGFSHHTATIWVKGYSMRPFLEHARDRVILAYPTSPLQVGDAVLAEVSPGQYVLHRIIEIEGDALTLMGDGNIRGVEHCRVSDVAGVVTHYIRPKRTLRADDAGLMRRIRWWRRCLPIRRYLLLVYRATV